MEIVLKVLRKFSSHVHKIHETKLWRMDRNRHVKVELSQKKMFDLFQ